MRFVRNVVVKVLAIRSRPDANLQKDGWRTSLSLRGIVLPQDEHAAGNASLTDAGLQSLEAHGWQRRDFSPRG
jgi:hypothetical protein